MPSDVVGPIRIEAEVTIIFPNGQRFTTTDTGEATLEYTVLKQSFPRTKSQWAGWKVVVEGFGKPDIVDACDIIECKECGKMLRK